MPPPAFEGRRWVNTPRHKVLLLLLLLLLLERPMTYLKVEVACLAGGR